MTERKKWWSKTTTGNNGTCTLSPPPLPPSPLGLESGLRTLQLNLIPLSPFLFLYSFQLRWSISCRVGPPMTATSDPSWPPCWNICIHHTLLFVEFLSLDPTCFPLLSYLHIGDSSVPILSDIRSFQLVFINLFYYVTCIHYRFSFQLKLQFYHIFFLYWPEICFSLRRSAPSPDTHLILLSVENTHL